MSFNKSDKNPNEEKPIDKKESKKKPSVLSAFAKVFTKPFTLRKRERAFVDRCHKIMAQPKFKDLFGSTGFVKNSGEQRYASADLLKLFFGKNGFLVAGVDLDYGEFPRLAQKSRALYLQLKMEACAQEAQKTCGDTAGLISEYLDKIITLYNKLSFVPKDFKAAFIDFLYKGSDALAATEAVIGGTYAAIGATTAVIVKPFLDAGWTHWFLINGTLCGPSNVALMTVGTTMTYAGLAVVALVALYEIATKTYKNYQNEKDQKIMQELTSSLSKLKTALHVKLKDLEKQKSFLPLLDKFCNNIRMMWGKYLNARRRTYNRRKLNLNGNYGTLIKSDMEGLKMGIAVQLMNLYPPPKLGKPEIKKAFSPVIEELEKKPTAPLSVNEEKNAKSAAVNHKETETQATPNNAGAKDTLFPLRNDQHHQ